MTIRIAPFDPHTASNKLWAAFNETRRAIACEFWPDEPTRGGVAGLAVH